MRPILLTLLAASVLTLSGPRRAPGQCWGGSCAPAVAGPAFAAPIAPAPALAFPIYQWHPLAGGEWALTYGGRQLGTFRAADGCYFRYHGDDRWDAQPSTPPVKPPSTPPVRRVQKKIRCACTGGCPCEDDKCDCSPAGRCSTHCSCQGKAKQNFGVVTEKISGRERVTLNGEETSKALALEALRKEESSRDNTVPDDSNKPSLTVIGTDAERQRVLADLATPAFAAWRETVLVQDYDPNGPAAPLLRCGFQTDGHPTIYLQAPDGKVLARVDHYDGPETLEAVRKADPNYQPAKDPDPTRPALASLEASPEILVLGGLSVLAVVLAGALLVRRK